MKSFNQPLVASLIALLLGALSLPALGAAQKFTLDPEHTQIRVTWNHAGFSNPGATFDIGDGTLMWDDDDPSRSSVTVTIPVKSVDTRVPALDDAFKTQYFDVAKYPAITFKSIGVERGARPNHYRIKGRLTVHGITKPVTLDAVLNKKGEHPMLKAPAIGFDATVTLNRSEFGLGVYVPLVSDAVKVHLTVEAVDPATLAKAAATRAE